MALLRHVLAILLAVQALGFNGTLAAADLTDAQLRAGLLYNFAQFVEWPATAKADETLLVGVLGDDFLAAGALHAIAGRKVNGRKVVVRAVDGSDDLERLAILYIGADDDRAVAAALARVARAPVLTVGDNPRFTKLGGIVRLYVDGAKARFEINVGRSQQCDLRISSKLLNLARIMGEP